MAPADNEQARPTKKQRELLDFIEKFVSANGYGPSYREIMKGCNYNSVATVALHVNNLIGKNQLRKKDRSARSLEVVNRTDSSKKFETTNIKPAEEKWLVDKIDYRFRQLESVPSPNQSDIDGLYVLVGALKVLGLEGASQSFTSRLSELKQRLTN
jgi:SOS-response transcriptional repressor LexA